MLFAILLVYKGVFLQLHKPILLFLSRKSKVEHQKRSLVRQWLSLVMKP
jgi:hypothetical protein